MIQQGTAQVLEIMSPSAAFVGLIFLAVGGAVCEASWKRIGYTLFGFAVVGAILILV